MILYCVLTAIVLFVIYNVMILSLFGVPKSLSMTYYLFKNVNDSLRHMFPFMMITLTLLLAPCWLEISEGSDYQFAAFLSIAGVMFVGMSPSFMDSTLESTVHSVSAGICAAFAMLWIILVTPYWYIILIVAVMVASLAIVTKTCKTSYIYWLEMIAFISTFAVLSIYVWIQ